MQAQIKKHRTCRAHTFAGILHCTYKSSYNRRHLQQGLTQLSWFGTAPVAAHKIPRDNSTAPAPGHTILVNPNALAAHIIAELPHITCRSAYNPGVNGTALATHNCGVIAHHLQEHILS
jgi:hypothetical protein